MAIVIGVLFFGTLIVLGITFTAKAIYMIPLTKKAQKCPRVLGKIKGYFMYADRQYRELSEPLDGKETQIGLVYEYSFEGENYESFNLTLEAENSDKIESTNNRKGIYIVEQDKFIDSIRKMPYVNVWVNHNHTKKSALIVSHKSYFFNLVVGIMLLVWGLGIPLFMFGGFNTDKWESKIKVVQQKTEEEYQKFEEIQRKRWEDDSKDK